MNRILRLILVLIVLAPISTLAVNSVDINDFQHSVTLSDAKKRFRSLDLPAEVLYTLQRVDMGDLRVFDDRGQTMPILILRKNSESVKQNQSLSFYPLTAKPSSASRISDVEVERNANGDVIRIHPRTVGQSEEPQTRVNQYLIENSQSSLKLERLILDWSQARQAQVSMRIDHSDNLVDWKTLVSRAIVARLQHNGSQLEQNIITLPGNPSRFLRISLLEADRDFSIHGITGQYRSPAAAVENWLTLGGLQKPQQMQTGNYEFKISSTIRPEKIQFKAPEQTEYYVSGKLYSRPDPQNIWRLRMREFSQYAVKQGNQWFSSGPLTLPYVDDKLFRLELSDGQNLPVVEKLSIELLMPAYELVFIAAGVEPFALAWGKSNIEPDNYAMESLFEQFRQRANDLEPVMPEQDLYLQNMEQPQVIVATNWKPLILWSVLLLGVILVAVMAYQLKKELAGNNNRGASS